MAAEGIAYSEPASRVEPRETQVRAETTKIDGALSTLFATIDQLEGRLTQVLLPEGPTLATPTPSDGEGTQRVLLADELRSVANRVFAADERVASMIRRLEV